ncbi:hypothetical protein F5Y15DRAFT_348175 [Xylariaceae sp. FL0016]|nr:hypothetical protein F5Y15DRAFT_348175 [Xylariaceae sp. FL0016]
MSTTLPSSRALLTSLILTLTSTDVPEAASSARRLHSAKTSQSTRQPVNPLQLIPPSHRSLLTTLHVLYPNTLLPALDLLDRRLVTRIIVDARQTTDSDEDCENKPDSRALPSQPHTTSRANPSFHLVRSAQPPSRRQTHHNPPTGPGPGQCYTVRLASWNCSCAAFAFSAFPAAASSSASAGYDIKPAADAISRFAPRANESNDESEGNDIEDWEFGGLSTDGKATGADSHVPCCKHLLACVLAERWANVLGDYVEEIIVGQEEGAGLASDM